MMIKLSKRLHMWMGWKPLSLTAYLLELERDIWEQTNNHFWKIKILTLSASSGIYHSIVQGSSTRAEQTPGWIKTNSLISHHTPPLPPFAVTQTMVTALSVQDLIFPSLDPGTGSQKKYDSEGLMELRGFHSVQQTSQGRGLEQGETQWLDSAAAQVGT